MKVVRNRNIYFAIFWTLFVISLFFLFWMKLNLWIDMTGWVSMEYDYKKIDFDKVDKEIISKSKLVVNDWKEVINNTNIYKVTWKNQLVVVAWFDSTIEPKKLDELKVWFKKEVFDILKKEDNSVIESSYVNIWKSFWDYIQNTAYLTLTIAIIAIALYVAWAFSGFTWWISAVSFWTVTIITLFHDVITAAWFYVATSDLFPQFKVDTFFITALLTILWYSINDTIVVFDRIRSNLKEAVKSKKTLEEVIDMSVTETLRRSLLTPLTVIFVLVSILIFWPEPIKWFTLVMLYGTVIWTFSSIYIASPLLYEINKNKKIEFIEKKKITDYDKVVV